MDEKKMTPFLNELEKAYSDAYKRVLRGAERVEVLVVERSSVFVESRVHGPAARRRSSIAPVAAAFTMRQDY
jgi:hypothetical protein